MQDKTKAIIFDFDGVIADSFDWFIKFLAREINKLPLAENELEELRGLSLKAAALELGHPFWRLPGLYYYGRRELGHHIRELTAFDDIAAIIRELHGRGYRLFIISSNATENIERFLVDNDLSDQFERIYGNIGFGGKARILQRIIRQNSLSKRSTCYICDEVRDLIAARHARVKTIAVTWGYNGRAPLARHKPGKIIDTPAQLVELLQ